MYYPTAPRAQINLEETSFSPVLWDYSKIIWLKEQFIPFLFIVWSVGCRLSLEAWSYVWSTLL